MSFIIPVRNTPILNQLLLSSWLPFEFQSSHSLTQFWPFLCQYSGLL
ncbi:14026_t:CDS:2 [Ambispora leptoticha]|uniref:14026_t:CDS:1 n=1 Tax=Ambispora leptoticha TaxID=144679 RepID=A0A9N9EWG2_9GLOM|nr:14026_t:CDS:2 [Ambispora leptoticha]